MALPHRLPPIPKTLAVPPPYGNRTWESHHLVDQAHSPAPLPVRSKEFYGVSGCVHVAWEVVEMWMLTVQVWMEPTSASLTSSGDAAAAGPRVLAAARASLFGSVNLPQNSAPGHTVGDGIGR